MRAVGIVSRNGTEIIGFCEIFYKREGIFRSLVGIESLLQDDETMLKVFVYGTLKPGGVNYLRYCEGKVYDVQPAYTWGKLYRLCLGYPGMTVGEEKVEGVVLTLLDDGVLSQLDELEDYDPQRPAIANQYNRKKIPVYDPQGESLGQVWAYVMSLERVQQYQGIPITTWTV